MGIVADRGFGNRRFAEDCQYLGFGFLLRIKTNLIAESDEKQGKINDILHRDGSYNLWLNSCQKQQTIVRCSRREKVWYLLTDQRFDDFGEAQKLYAEHFGIERVFKEMKSAGFNIENIKITKLPGIHLMLFLCCVSYVLRVLSSTFITENKELLRKRFPLQNAIATVYLPLQEGTLRYYFSPTIHAIIALPKPT